MLLSDFIGIKNDAMQIMILSSLKKVGTSIKTEKCSLTDIKRIEKLHVHLSMKSIFKDTKPSCYFTALLKLLNLLKFSFV